jgi:signal transduction histidine kinase/DNA-binding response OmpR family regulator
MDVSEARANRVLLSWRFPEIDGRAIVFLAITGVVLFAATWGGIVLTRTDGQIASVWIVNGIVLGLVLRHRPAPRGTIVAVAFVANFTADLCAGASVFVAFGLSASNIFEILVAAYLIKRMRWPFVEWGELGEVGRLVIFAGLVAPASSAIVGAGILQTTPNGDFISFAIRWSVAHGLGMILMAPLVLAADWKAVFVRTLAGTVEALVILGCAVAATVLIFGQDDYPLTFALLPILILADFRLRIFDALLGTLLVSIATTLLTLDGKGRFAASIAEVPVRILFLQAFLAITVLTTLAIATVLNERDKMRRELVRTTAAAEAALATKSAFLATMSHEIRTPMTGVLGMIELLRSEPGERDKRRFFASLQLSADLLMRVLDDVLDFSKIESGKIELETVAFDLRHLARATLDLYTTAANDKHLYLTLDISAGDAVVVGDPVRLQQVLANLVSNAIKFSEVGGIKLKIARPSSSGSPHWNFAVTDTGIGIAPDQIDRLFLPFIQADASTTRKFGGTGLGLAICRRLVEAMGGKLAVDSTVGLGTTFAFWLGLPAGSLATELPTSADEAAPTATLSILLAEDNPVNQMLVRTMLQRMGHHVTGVVNGREAVEAAAAGRFDLILMDMQMPEMDGLAATRAIRAADHPWADVPIVALTADASPDRRRFYDNVGLTDFLTKPIDSARLRACLAGFAAAPLRHAPPAFDAAKVAEIAEAIGSENLVALLDLLAINLAKRPAAMVALLQRGKIRALQRDCHSLRGAASSIGADEVARTAAVLEQADRDLDASTRVLPEFKAAVDAALEAIPLLRAQYRQVRPLADAG